MRSWAGITHVPFHLPASSCPLSLPHLHLHLYSTLHLPQKENGSAQSSRREEHIRFSLSCGGWGAGFVFCHVDDMNDSRWISKDISEISRQWWRKGRKPELILWEFSTQVSNSLNSNQAQDACISIWVVHQRAKRKEIWAGADSGLKAFKLISFRKETISFVCTGSGKLLFWNLVHSQLGSQFCWPVNKIRSMEVSAIPQKHTHTQAHIQIYGPCLFILEYYMTQIFNLGWFKWSLIRQEHEVASTLAIQTTCD